MNVEIKGKVHYFVFNDYLKCWVKLRHDASWCVMLRHDVLGTKITGKRDLIVWK